MKYKATKQNLKKAFGWALIWTGRLLNRTWALIKKSNNKNKTKKSQQTCDGGILKTLI